MVSQDHFVERKCLSCTIFEFFPWHIPWHTLFHRDTKHDSTTVKLAFKNLGNFRCCQSRRKEIDRRNYDKRKRLCREQFSCFCAARWKCQTVSGPSRKSHRWLCCVSSGEKSYRPITVVCPSAWRSVGLSANRSSQYWKVAFWLALYMYKIGEENVSFFSNNEKERRSIWNVGLDGLLWRNCSANCYFS